MLSSEQLLSIRSSGDPAPAQPHVDHSCAFPDRNFALRFALLASNGGRENRSVILDQVDEQN